MNELQSTESVKGYSHGNHKSHVYWKQGMLGLSLGLVLAGNAFGQETLVFATEDPGEIKSIPEWGLDTAWLSWDNVHRGVNYMGQAQTDVIRFSFTGDWALDNGALAPEAQAEFDNRMSIVDTYCDAHTALYLNNDTDDWNTNPYLVTPNQPGVDPYLWAQLIDVTRQACEDAGRAVLSVSVFNEPDHATYQGDVIRFGDVCWQLRNTFGANFTGITLFGGNTLNNDQAAYWYDTLNGWGYLEEGNTHQLAGSFDTYAAFYQSVEANGDIGTNDELHNIMEAIVGAEYGMDVGIWWGTAERARGELVKATDGQRLSYAENRAKWTAAAVYRAPSGAVKGFVGESERQAVPTTYRFVAKDRPVFYDGVGPQRVFDVTTTGDPNYGYMTADHHNAEKVVNITWGDDVQPAINGRYYLVNRNSHKLMDVYGGEAAIGDWVRVDQWSFTGGLNQQWDVVPLASTSGGDYSYCTIKAVHSGEAATLDRDWSVDWGYADGAGIWQRIDGDGSWVEQQYYLEYVEDGWFKIHTRWTNKCLGIDGGSTGDGASVLQWTDTGSYDQQWRLVPVGADPTDFTAPTAPSGVAAAANPVSVQLSWNVNSEGDLAGYNVLRSTTSGGPYEIIARGITANAFTDSSANQSIPYYYVVKAVDLSLNRSSNSAQASATPIGGATLVADYGFEGDLADATINGNDAIAYGTAAYGAGSLDLDGQSGYAALPAEVVDYDQVTIAAWVYWNGGSVWQRIFDFGNGMDEYLFLTPANWDGNTMQFTISNNGVGNDLYAPALPVGEWTHVAVTLSNQTANLYVNGTNVASSASFTIKPSDFNPVVNYIGKSQFPDDALFSGSMDDFRVYNYALSATEIAALNPTPITPWININWAGWQEGVSDATLNEGDTIVLGPQPLTGGSWSWSGPNGFSSTSREITLSNVTVSDAGPYVATFTNDEGAESQQVFNIVVVSSVTDIYVNDIAMSSAQYGGGRYSGIATITVKDDSGAAVPNATVSITWSGATSETDSGTTDGSGIVVFESSKKKNGGTFTVTVTDVTVSGSNYNATLNVETSDSITAP